MLTAEQLGITPEELLALRQVRELLTKDQLTYVRKPFCSLPGKHRPVFNMGFTGSQYDCGTTACIGGWMSIFMDGIKPNEQGLYPIDSDRVGNYVASSSSEPLHPLFYPLYANSAQSDTLVPDHVRLNSTNFGAITDAQAVQAIDNFLTTGKPDWWSIVKDHRDIVDIEENDE